MPTGVQHAHTQWTLGWVCGRRGDDREAIEHVTRALAAFHAVALPDWEAEALSAVECFAAGDYDKARIHCNAALALFPVHAGPDARAGVLDSLGHIEHHSGHPRQAIAYYHQALDGYHAAGNTCGSADALSRLGQSYAAIAEHELARTAWREALAAFREQGRQEEADRVQQRLDMLRGEGSRASR